MPGTWHLAHATRRSARTLRPSSQRPKTRLRPSKLLGLSKQLGLSKLLGPRALLSALVLSGALTLSACSSSTVNLAVYLSPEVAQTYGEVPSLEVDVAGVTAAQKQALEHTTVEQYFAPHSTVRASIQPITLYFSPLQQRPYSIEKSFAAWELWEQRGAEYVMVLCNLPKLSAASKDGAPDSRMLFIEMHDGFIKDSSSHIVEITSSGVIKVADEPEPQSSPSLAQSAEPSAQEQALAAALEAEAQALQSLSPTDALESNAPNLNVTAPFEPIVLE